MRHLVRVSQGLRLIVSGGGQLLKKCQSDESDVDRCSGTGCFQQFHSVSSELPVVLTRLILRVGREPERRADLRRKIRLVPQAQKIFLFPPFKFNTHPRDSSCHLVRL